MNIQNVNNVPNPLQQNPLQAAQDQNRQQEQNAVQNQANQEVERDNFTRSQAADRLRTLNNRRQELVQQLGALEQNLNVNQNQPGENQGAEIRQELDQVNRELRNIARPENEAATRRQREAINQYTEQNQNVLLARMQTRRTMNLFGE